MENKVSVKYKTKKIKTDWNEFFLATINHIIAKPISSRNLRLIETRLWNVWGAGSFVWPLKKMISVNMAITEKTEVRTAISLTAMLSHAILMKKYPMATIRISNTIRNNIYLKRDFNLRSLDKIFHSSVDSCKNSQQ